MRALDTPFELLTFALLPDVGPRKMLELRALGPLSALAERPAAARGILPPESIERLRSGEAARAAEAEQLRSEVFGLRLVGLDDSDYPALLRQVFDPPSVLYVRGNLEGCRPEIPAVAIVGSRGASPHGVALARALGRDLADAGATIVSGLARGIDTAAHQGALDACGVTLAIQGRGMDDIYPKENTRLADAIVSAGGAVLAECPLGVRPLADNFPRRNRIIAGLTRATIVVEAARRSGALITARVALDEGRDVMAVPGHPSDERSFGPNALIRDGALLVRDAADVAAELGLEGSAIRFAASQDVVLGALRPDVPASLEDLATRSGRPLPELLARLSELEIGAKVRRLPGALFVRARNPV